MMELGVVNRRRGLPTPLSPQVSKTAWLPLPGSQANAYRAFLAQASTFQTSVTQSW